MRITAENILVHELIGLRASVTESRDPTLAKLNGMIVYETKNTLLLRTEHDVKKIPKSAVSLAVTLPDGSICVVNGRDLVGRSEDRIQRLR